MKCPACDGDGWTVEPECCGWTVEPECCGRPGTECCGSPRPVQVQCERCNGTGSIPESREVS